MKRVLKVVLTRRLFWLFFSLALIPTLFMTILFSVLRIRADQQNLLELERDLVAKPTRTFNLLVSSKAEHFQQILDFRADFATLLATSAAQSSQFTLASIAEFLTPVAITASQADPAIRSVAVFSATQARRVYPLDISADIETMFLSAADWSEMKSGQLSWMLRESEGEMFLSTMAPIEVDSQIIAVVVIDYWLDQMIEEIPRYYLADRAVMFFVSSDLTYIGLPSWNSPAEYFQDYFDLPADSETIHLDEPRLTRQAQELSDLISQSHEQPALKLTDFTQLPCYVAVKRIDGTVLSVVLLLPMEEVISTARSYGAPFQSEAPTILMQTLFTVIGLMISVGIGAMVTLRTLAEPIQELSKGSQEVAQGNLGYKVPVGGIGEISELGNSFNTMVAAIQSTQLALERKRSELEATLATQKKEFALINQVSYQANLTVDLPKKLTTTLEIILKELGMSAGFIYLLNEVGGLFGTSAVITENIAADPTAARLSNSGESLARRVVENRSVVFSDGILDLSSSRGEQAPEQISFDSIGAPIQFRDRMLGVMVLYHKGIEQNMPSIENFVTAISTHIAVLIEVSRLQNQARFLVVAEERRRLARDLHDSVTQTLFSLSMALDGVINECQELPEAMLDRMNFVSEQALAARTQMRAMIYDLRPLDLGRQTLDEAIKAHASDLTRSSEIKLKLELSGNVNAIPIPIQYNLDRIVQETLSNVARHAQASEVEIQLIIGSAEVELCVSDNGIGFVQSPENSGTSFGLMSIRERAEVIGGGVTIFSQLGKGTRVSVLVPLQGKHLE